jgi:hypothetical protein
MEEKEEYLTSEIERCNGKKGKEGEDGRKKGGFSLCWWMMVTDTDETRPGSRPKGDVTCMPAGS